MSGGGFTAAVACQQSHVDVVAMGKGFLDAIKHFVGGVLTVIAISTSTPYERTASRATLTV
ncbi:MAG: hypothetical protein H0W25_08900 [Acidimicrobiia bacterium]|nr:hypothetical protein [Acidimicrobiia bacterium]